MERDDEIDDRLREIARTYHEPPETPRDLMWRSIQARRVRRPVRRPAFWAAAAAVAVLAAGIGIGRLTSPVAPAPEAPIARTPDTAASSPTAYRLAALEHLAQSEEFLILFRDAVGRRNDHRLASATARRLLATNRLLLDSPAAIDRRTRALLEDLELVLAGIAQLAPGSPQGDGDLVRDAIERSDVMPRLRTALPPGQAPTQGAL